MLSRSTAGLSRSAQALRAAPAVTKVTVAKAALMSSHVPMFPHQANFATGPQMTSKFNWQDPLNLDCR